MLSPHLNETNGASLLKACIGKSKRQIEEVLASGATITRPIRESVGLVPPVIQTLTKPDAVTPKAHAELNFDTPAPEQDVRIPEPKASPDVHISLTS